MGVVEYLDTAKVDHGCNHCVSDNQVRLTDLFVQKRTDLARKSQGTGGYAISR